MIRLLGVSLLAFLFSVTTAAQDLSLGAKAKGLQTTADSKLGTLDGDYGLPIGSEVVAFQTRDHFGEAVDFGELMQQGPLLVIFYRGGWCPYCNRQVYQLTKAWPKLRSTGITPVLISADKPDAAALAQRTYDIPFPVLADPDLEAHNSFRVALDVDDKTLKKLRNKGVVLEQWSGRDHHKIAVPSVFIVNRDGKVQWAHSSVDHKTRPSVKQLIKVISALDV